MKRQYVLMFFLFLTILARAQMVKPFVVNSAGGSATVGGNVYDWSFAEMVMINTSVGTNMIVTAGLMQPIDPNVGTEELVQMSETVKVFPNPTSGAVNIETAFNQEGTLNFQLFDISGRLLERGEKELDSGTSLTDMDISQKPAGDYLLRINFSSGTGKGIFQKTFKIQKLN